MTVHGYAVPGSTPGRPRKQPHRGELTMLEIIIALLTAVVPPCATEDSDMCLHQDNDRLIVNLAPADPAPESIVIDDVNF